MPRWLFWQPEVKWPRIHPLIYQAEHPKVEACKMGNYWAVLHIPQCWRRGVLASPRAKQPAPESTNNPHTRLSGTQLQQRAGMSSTLLFKILFKNIHNYFDVARLRDYIIHHRILTGGIQGQCPQTLLEIQRALLFLPRVLLSHILGLEKEQNVKAWFLDSGYPGVHS